MDKFCSPMSFTASTVLLFLLIAPSVSFAESQFFLGVEPQVHSEEWYASDEMDTNILPLVYERPVSAQTSLRLRSNFYLHTGGTAGTDISLVGLGAAYLWYLESLNEKGLHGFNIGPNIIYSYDLLEKITHSTVALETGYSFALENDWTINVSAQAGRSYFSGGIHPASNHFGLYVSFGRW